MKRTFDIAAFCIYKSECWFFAKEFNCLFYKKIDSGNTAICGPVPWEPEKKELLYKEMEYVDGKLYLIPFRARGIAVYDIANKSYYKIELDAQMFSKGGNFFRAGLVYDKYIYAFGIHVPTIMVINTANDNVEYLTRWYEEVKEHLTNSSRALFRKQLVVIGKMAYIPMAYGDIVLSICLETKQVIVNYLKFKSTGYVGITNDEENIYLASRAGQGFIGCWNCNTKEEKVIGYLNQDGVEVNKYLAYISSIIEVYYMKYDRNKLSGENIHSAEYNCDCLLSNGYANAFFCDNGKVLLISNNDKRQIDISIEITGEDERKIRELNSFFKETKWYGIKQLIEELVER